MKSISKKPIAILLTILMIVGLLTGLITLMTSTAYGYEVGDIWIDTDGNQMSSEHASQWDYTLSGENVTLTKYRGEVVDGKIVGRVPATINGNVVTSLAGTFNQYNNSKLGRLTEAPALPRTIVSMVRTFERCSGLVKAPEVPYGVTDMESAFSGCSELVDPPELPDTVTNLRYTFRDCKKLVSTPELPDSVTNMNYTFQGCSSLTGVVDIPDNIDNVSGTFDGTALPITMRYSQFNIVAQKATVPNNVTRKAYLIEDTSGHSNWIDANGKVMTLNETGLWDVYSYLGSYNPRYIGPIIDGRIVGQVPAIIDGKQVTHLGRSGDSYYGSFYGNKELVHAPKTPDGVKVTGQMFMDNTSLTGDVYIPDSVENATDMFKGTVKPITVYFNNSVSVGGNTVNAIAKEVYPDNVTKISTDTDVWIGTDGKVMSPEHKGQWAYRYQNSSSIRLTKYTGKYTADGRIVGSVPATINGIPIEYLDGTFQQDKNIKIVPELPDTLKGMNSAFAYTNIQAFTNRLTKMSDMSTAFRGCKDLTGDILISDSVNSYPGLNDIFRDTSKPITMYYNASNNYAAGVSVPYNVTKVAINSMEDLESSEPIDGVTPEGDIVVEITSANGNYSIEAGNELQLQATVSRDDLKYRWVIQDIYDINGQNNYYATIDEDGKVTGVEAGYAIVGLMVKFEDGSEETYGLTIIEVTKDGRYGYGSQEIYYRYYGGSGGIYTGGIGGVYDGGWNYGYSSSGSSGSWFTADSSGGNFTFNPDLGGGGTGGDGESGGGGDSGEGGDGGGTGGEGNTGDEGMATEDSNLQIIGLVESITTLDVDVPLSINFVIDAERNFIKPDDLKIVSNCPAPLKVSIYEVDKKTDAPDIVQENSYTDNEWNNLNRKQTSENIALSLNSINLSTKNVELGTLKSAFKESQELNIDLTSKYGKAWSNKETIEFSYNIVFVIGMQ